MSKHEAKISRTAYIIRMFFAVLISFGLGLGTGFFFSNNPKQTDTKEKQEAVNNNQPNAPIGEQTPQSAPKELSKDDQLNIVASALNTYYGIDTNQYNKFKNESLAESKNSSKTQDAIFKEKLYNVYQQVLTKTELASMKTFIDGGSLKTNYYFDFFKTMQDIQIKKNDIVEFKETSIKAKSEVINVYEYDTPYKNLSSTDFLNKYKGKGITKDQYIKMNNLKPSKVSVIQTKSVNTLLEKLNDKWMIADYTASIVSSEIKEVTLNGKTIKFADFAKTYLK